MCIRDRLKALRAPETAGQFEAQGADPAGNSPEEFAVYLKREYDKTARVVTAAGLRVD
jgi:tripartite-type tricarboxylate transporter receptor subunit TctC